MSDIKSDKSEVLHYDNPDFPVFIRKNYIPYGVEFSDAFVHWHDEVEFIYVLSGDIGYLIDGKKIAIHAGEGVFVNSRHLHRIMNGSTDCELICLIFSTMILCTTKYVAGKMVQPILTAGNLPYLFLEEKVAWQKEVLDYVAHIYQKSIQVDEELEILASVYKIWKHILKNIKGRGTEKMVENNDLMCVKNMIGFIQGSYDGQVVLADICASGNVGKNKCNALFKKYTNMSPVDYLRYYRVEKSVELLRNTNMTITEIAYETGFTGASYYAETFRKYIGCTPMQYREKSREA